MVRVGCIARIFFKVLMVSVLLLLLAMLAVLAWFATAPRSLPFGHETMMQLVEYHTGAEELSFNKPLFYINVKKKRLEADIRNIHARMAETHLSADMVKLAMPISGFFNLHLSYEGFYIKELALMPPHEEYPIHVSSFRINPDIDNGEVNAFNLELRQGDSVATVIGSIRMLDRMFDIQAVFNNMPASIFSLIYHDIGEVDTHLDGTIKGLIKKNTRIKELEIHAHAEELSYHHPIYYPDKALNLRDIATSIIWNTQTKQFDLDSMQMRYGEDTLLSLSASVDPMTQNAELIVNLTQLPVDALATLWPKGVADPARKWVTERIKHGVVTEGNAQIALAEGGKNILLESALQLEGITVQYADHLPAARQAKGIAYFTEDSMKIEVSEAKTLKDSTLKDALVEIPSFSDGGIAMHVVLPIKASAKDIASYLSKQHLDKAQELGLQPETIQGKATGTVELFFPLYPAQGGMKGGSFDHLDMQIDATLQDVSQSNVLNKWDIENLNGNISINNEQITLKGKAQLQQSPATLDVLYSFKGKQAGNAEYHVTLLLNEQQLALFDVPIPDDYVQGKVTLQADIIDKADKKRINATLDFTDATITVDAVGWQKAEGQPATLHVVQHSSGQEKRLESLRFVTDGTQIEGNAKLLASGQIASLELHKLATPFIDASLSYQQQQDQEVIVLKGNSITLNTEEEPETDEPTEWENPFHYLFNRHLTIALEQLNTSQGSLRNVRVNTDCHKNYCASFYAKASYGNTDEVIAEIFPHGSKRRLRLKASDIGSLAHLFDVEGDVRGGQLSIKGEFDDSLPARPLTARLILQHVTTRELPALTNLLTLASLRGIADTLSGNGIAFDKIAADIIYDGKTITVNNLAAKGAALGIMLDGWLRPYGKGLINLEGTLIPSYTLNSFVGKVPLLGELLVGGEDEGLLATRFSVRGKLHDPTVVVNPLSMLTPGFLRNIFEVFPDIQPVDLPEENQ